MDITRAKINTHWHFINELRDRKFKEPWYKRNLSEWFHFRLFVELHKWRYRFEACSKWAFRCSIDLGEEDTEFAMVSLGLIFFSVYIGFPLPRWCFKGEYRELDNGKKYFFVDRREYGFYLYSTGKHWWNFDFVGHWMNKPWESNSKDPWWMRVRIAFDDLILGKRLRIATQLDTQENIFFRMGTKVFKIDKITVTRNEYFRSRIPFALYHRTSEDFWVDINKPPQFSGKGENSWDCGDDGI